ncbi:hypothetical protein PMZ80_000528 [Knufia obscura]|uniref:HCP-like protein n=1 Tax=Knufia obscura TaxID=1635080 RepID=A0ABR0S1J6_9EURO|nr:hypothetical protein PMZ80_000528 [Knufia obscura]
MPFRDLLKKKEKIEEQTDYSQPQQREALEPPAFKIVRSDTHTEELLDPPSFSPGDERSSREARSPPSSQRSIAGRFRSLSRSGDGDGSPKKDHKHLSDMLHLSRNKSRSSSASSANLPANLPDIQDAYNGNGDQEEKEAKWEQRATVLVSANRSPAIAASTGATTAQMSQLSLNTRPSRPRTISDAQSDVNIQNAIRLHEAGQLEEAARMFKQLADNGNVLSGVLYGLSLRHGWGCPKDESGAFTYLASAASDSAALEGEALKAGLKEGGAAKGELVLAIFELGNCYRYGWGTAIDKAAARQYYETAANLGDTDAMNEAAWCYLEGFGGKKDKFKAAQLLRLAEKNGSKTLGNSW